MRDLAGKRVLLTGAARGIGLAMARRFAAEGAAVVLTDLDAGGVSEAATGIRGAGGVAEAYALDVTDEQAVEALPERVAREGGPIDVLVNNAGVVFGGALTAVPLERHRRTFEINVLGVVAMTRAFLPVLVARPEAALVNVASASGFIGLPYAACYAASKWAVVGFSDSMRLELRELGQRHVRVTTVCPSYVTTGLFDGARPPRTTRMVTPERVAELTVRAVRAGRPFVLTPWLVKLTPALKGALPAAAFDVVARVFGVTGSMQGWRGHAVPPAPAPPTSRDRLR